MKNTQDIIDKIVEFYADYDYPAELVDKVQAWLGDDKYRDQKDRAMETALDKTVEMYDREQLYSRKEIDAALKNVRRKIGAAPARKVNMFSQRLRRVAAILVPIFLLAGIGLLLIDGDDDTTKISSTI